MSSALASQSVTRDSRLRCNDVDLFAACAVRGAHLCDALQTLEQACTLGLDTGEALNAGSCIVCMDAPATHAIMPCGHLCLCNDCAKKLLDAGDDCPICRAKIESTQQIYLAGDPDDTAPSAPPAPEKVSEVSEVQKVQKHNFNTKSISPGLV